MIFPPATIQMQPNARELALSKELNDFSQLLMMLIPCRLSVAPFSPIPPSEACCSALRSLGQPCLCVLVNGPPISGVDRNMALQLPEKCTANFEPCDIMK
ncbi:protein M7-like [Senna tora]|uniref:Protein M7-like n=1 Tax=Senna tora TaxID=362788 RepID=A0A834TQ12_9FABA|nr:protein M7-like [Senna tora]